MKQRVLALLEVSRFYLMFRALLVITVRIFLVVVLSWRLLTLNHTQSPTDRGYHIILPPALLDELALPKAVLPIATVKLLNLLCEHVLNQVKDLRSSC